MPKYYPIIKQVYILQKFLYGEPSPSILCSDFGHAGNCPPYVHITLESLERIMATAFWLLIIIIHMLNTIACVAVKGTVSRYCACTKL